MLTVQTRTILGKKTKVLRKQGIIPAVLYGPKRKNLNIAVNEKEFLKALKIFGENRLLDLEIEKEKNKNKVLIRDIARDPVSDRILHIDFYAVDLDKEITAKVPLSFVGVSLAVKDLYGVLVKNLQELTVECLPADLPKTIEVDITNLKTFEDSVYLQDLKIPSKVKILEHNLNEVIANVTPPRSEEELEKLDEAVEEKIEEVEKVEKKDEDAEDSEDETIADESKEQESEEKK